MADLKLKSVVIRNWMKYVNVEVEFPDKGLVLVSGSNAASGGKLASVGAGKTGFGEAFCRTLLGTKGRFTHAKSFSKDKKGDSYVRVTAEHRGVPLIVENGYKCAELGGPGEALRYKFGTKDAVERSRIDETRDEIAAIVGVSPALADWTVFIDGRRIEFDKLSQEDAVNLVMASLMQPPWTQFYERSRAVVSNFKQITANSESNRTDAIRRLAAASTATAEAEKALKSEEVAYREQRRLNDERIKVLTAEKSAKNKSDVQIKARKVVIGKRLIQIEDEKAADAHVLEIERNSVDDELRSVQEKRDAAVEKRSNAKAEQDSALRALHALESVPKDCPQCGKPWDKAHGDEEIKKQKAKVKSATKGYDAAAAEVMKVSSTLESLQAKRREVSTKLQSLGASTEVKSLSNEYATLERDEREIARRVHAIDIEIVNLKKDVSDSGVKSCESVLQERKKVEAGIELEVSNHASALAENESILNVANYWNRAFSPTGIPNMVLSEAIGPLNEVSRAISNRMTGGTIHVTYATSKQLATGAAKSKLVINVENEIGDSEIQGSSKGEGGLTNFIISETLSEVGNVSNRVGFRWYDEIVPNQDPVVAKSIYAYMRETAHRLGILIFLVDHNPAAESFADHVLLVEKTRTGTSVSWR